MVLTSAPFWSASPRPVASRLLGGQRLVVQGSVALGLAELVGGTLGSTARSTAGDPSHHAAAKPLSNRPLSSAAKPADESGQSAKAGLFAHERTGGDATNLASHRRARVVVLVVEKPLANAAT
jgi:hypothetical protein